MIENPVHCSDGSDRPGTIEVSSGLVIRHAAVAGRLRLAVPLMRGDRRLADWLAKLLPGQATISEARANSLTGNLLLRFDPDTPIARVIRTVASLLREPAPQPQEVASTRSQISHMAAPADREEARAWHAMTAAEISDALRGDPIRGLSEGEAERRLQSAGPNALARVPPRSSLAILEDQVVTLPVGLLVGSAVLSFVTGGVIDAVAILVVSAINTVIGYTMESQAEKAVSLLDHGTLTAAHLVRNGSIRRVAAERVVPGDLLAISPGTLVPADARLVEASNLSVDESLLTGESLPVEKAALAMLPRSTPLAERRNMVYRGTAVTGGQGRSLVVETGPHTVVGTIQRQAGSARAPQTPAQRELGALGRVLGYLSLGICGAVMGLGMLRGLGWSNMFKASISVAVAAIPEGLPSVATVTMALGIREMRRRQVIVRRLKAVETLGLVDTICFDKTGTLTFNEMAAAAVMAGGRLHRATEAGFADGRLAEETARDRALSELLTVCILCNEAQISADPDGRIDFKGSATETALLRLATDGGLDPRDLRQRHPLLSAELRSETRKYMVTRHRRDEGGSYLAVKGSPGEVLAMCRSAQVDGAVIALDDRLRAKLLEANERMAGEQLRVLGFASGVEHSGTPGNPRPSALTWLGLAGLADPIRPGMPELLARFQGAGVRTVMITGDQTATAYAIAKRLNLSGDASVEILEGSDLASLDPELFAALARRTDVFARVTPADKLRIVQALQSAHQVVAMTGDGVNDSPALRVADIGVAMGSGSEAASEVADVILADDDLATMAVALAKGRSVYANIRKAVRFLLATNLSEVLVMLVGIGIGRRAPLTPLQLLWINLVSDVFPGIALGLEPPAGDILKRPPREAARPVLEARDLKRISAEAGIMALAALASEYYGRHRPGRDPAESGSDFAFTTLTSAQLLHALSCRSDRRSLLKGRTLAPNHGLSLVIAGLFALQAAASLLPAGRRLLGLTGMRPGDYAAAGTLALLPFAAIEAGKALSSSRLAAEPDTPAADSPMESEVVHER